MNINATLFVQIAVFVALWWFTAKFVWPPIVKSLDERSKRIADGLAAADKAKADLATAERRVADELKKARYGAAEVRSGAERQAGQLLLTPRKKAVAEYIREIRIDGEREIRQIAVQASSGDQTLILFSAISAAENPASYCRYFPRASAAHCKR